MLSSLTLLAQQADRTYFQLARLEMMTEWWQWLLLILVCLAVTALIIVMYVFDSVELPVGVALVLGTLRVLAFVGLLVFFLQPELRTEQKVVKPSRVSVLFDISSSMALEDTVVGSADGGRGAVVGPSRIQQVVAELEKGTFVEGLRKHHDVVAYAFNEDAQPTELATFPRLPDDSVPDAATLARQQSERAYAEMTVLFVVSAGFLAASLIAGVAFLLVRNASGSGSASWALLFSIVTVIIAVVLFAVANLRNPHVSMRDVIAREKPAAGEQIDDEQTPAAREAPEVDWARELEPRGNYTRLGDALRYVVNKERGGPVAGLVVFTDGASNAGVAPGVAAAAARSAGIPIYTVGIGSKEAMVDVQVVDVEAPPRVYPGDKFTLNGLIRASGMEDRTVSVELVSAPVSAEPGEDELLEEERRVKLGADGEEQALKFEVTPETEGRRTFAIRVIAPDDDRDGRNDYKRTTVEVVERKNKVFILAGGPSREYQFLSTMLYRDKDVETAVLLQTAQPGTAQEADDLLLEFPETRDELFEFDCIVAFDPDWDALTVDQVKMVEEFVAEQAGGLIVVAGPVHTPNWSRRPRGDDKMDEIKALYPVVFINRGAATIRIGRFGGADNWPLAFTRDGRDANFLWLADTPLESEQAWSEFEGVCGYYGVKDVKLGATVYARFSDPDTAASDGTLPVYLAGQNYGAGRVFFQASGEMWRIRAVDDTYFERYYTKLIRWASHGRLLRDSSRGVLLVDKDRLMTGEHVEIRAILQDPQRKPLEVEEVVAAISNEQNPGDEKTLTLRRVEGGVRPGMYAAQFTVIRAGDYRIDLPVPGGLEDEILSREFHVRVPQLEIEKPQLNDELLQDVAFNTGGVYYAGAQTPMRRNNVGSGEPLYDVIQPRDQETFLPGTPDLDFEELLRTWLLGLVVGVLSLEWLVRRLNKLA